jgi:capsular exopolysaccharide synthesis family protein
MSDMSRIQQILDKAEREGTALRTSRLKPSAPPPPPSAAVPLTIDIAPPARREAVVVPDASPDLLQHVAVRLHPVLVAGLAPKSLAAEQYRGLRTRLAHAEGATAFRSVMVTSPQKGEGKSVTSANLALTMAQELHLKVILVEADLRKPTLRRLFGLSEGPGLADYLAGAVELAEVMKFLPDHNLAVIPAGAAPPNPAELLGSIAMRRMLDQLRTRFDRVILDTPPVLPLADVAVLAPLVDGALLVVRAGVTPKPAIENALRAFDSSRLIGVVLNEAGVEQDYRHDATRN